MKSIFLTSLIVSAIALLVISCQNETQQIDVRPIPHGESQITPRTVDCSCSITGNSENDFNFVGQIHNELVCEYLEIYDDESKDIELLLFRVDSLANENSNFIAIKDLTYTMIEESTIIDGIEDVDYQFHNFINSLNLSDSVELQLTGLIDSLIILTDQVTAPTYNKVIQTIDAFEDDAIENAGHHSVNDQRTLLSSIATAKYSACFWYNFDLAAVEGGLTEPQKKAKWLRILFTVCADALGAAVGSIPATATSGVAGATIVAAAVGASTAAWNITNPNTK